MPQKGAVWASIISRRLPTIIDEFDLLRFINFTERLLVALAIPANWAKRYWDNCYFECFFTSIYEYLCLFYISAL